MTQEEFISDIKGVSKTRKHRLTRSYGCRDYYRNYIKQKKGLTQTQFTLILEGCFKVIAKLLLVDKEFILPCNMGSLEIRKHPKRIKLIDNKIKVNVPVDWKQTLELWYNNESARKKKTLVRCDHPWIFRVHYSKRHARFANEAFIKFQTTRNLKRALKDVIEKGNFDSFTLW